MKFQYMEKIIRMFRITNQILSGQIITIHEPEKFGWDSSPLLTMIARQTRVPEILGFSSVVPLPISGDTSNINPEFPGRYRKPLSRLIWANMSSWNPKYGVQSHDSPKSSNRHGWPWPIYSIETTMVATGDPTWLKNHHVCWFKPPLDPNKPPLNPIKPPICNKSHKNHHFHHKTIICFP